MLKGLADIAKSIGKKTANIGMEIVRGLLHGKKVPGRLGNSDDSGGIPSQANDILGSIYKLMVQAREEELKGRKSTENDHNKQLKKEDDRNAAIIKALSVKRKKTTKKEPPKEPKETPKGPPKEKPSAERFRDEKGRFAKKPSEKVTEAPTTPTATKSPTPSLPKPSTSAGKIPTGVGAGKSALISALAAAGYSQTAQANVLANVKEESNFIPHSENLGKYNATNLFKMFGPSGQEFTGRQGSGKGKKLIANPKNEKGKSNTVRFNNIEDAEKLVSQGPEAVAEVIYGGRMGNTSPGDGYKYIGRGYIQLTGKENYTKVGKLIGVDLVNNPELANDPEIAAKIVPAFFKVGGKKPADLENIDVAIDTVGSASASSREERKRLASEYQSKGFGDTLDQSSKENKDLKDAASAKKTLNVNTTNVAQSSNQAAQNSTDEQYDDRNAHQKKK